MVQSYEKNHKSGLKSLIMLVQSLFLNEKRTCADISSKVGLKAWSSRNIFFMRKATPSSKKKTLASKSCSKLRKSTFVLPHVQTLSSLTRNYEWLNPAW